MSRVISGADIHQQLTTTEKIDTIHFRNPVEIFQAEGAKLAAPLRAVSTRLQHLPSNWLSLALTLPGVVASAAGELEPSR